MNLSKKQRVVSEAIRNLELLLVLLRGTDVLSGVSDVVLRRIEEASDSIKSLWEVVGGGEDETE